MVNGVAFHPTKNVLASCSNDSTIKLWNTDTGAELSTLSCDLPVLSIDWHDQRVAAGCLDGTIKVFDAQSGDCLSTVNVGSMVFSVHFSPSGDTVAAGCYDGTVQIIDVATAEVKRPLHVGYAFSRCSTRISLPARPLFSRFSTRISV